MDAFAPPSIRRERRYGKVAAALEAVVVTLLLAWSLIGIPGTPDTRLDASWQLMLIHAHAAGLQFGRDIIFTWGPWGFLCCGYHLGETGAVPILVWQTAGQLLIALLIVLLTRGLVPWRRTAFAALFFAFHWLFTDVVYFVLITLIAVSGLMRRDAPLLRVVAWTLALGFLAQFKFTYFLLSSAGVLAAMACWAGRRSWARMAGAAAGYSVSVAASWVAAGQNPDNLYAYLRRGLDIAMGYGDAMGLDEPWPVFLWSAALALACAVFLLSAWRAVPERSYALGACGYLAFSFLVMWKESCTRADFIAFGGHVFGLFTYCLILAPVLPGLLFPGRRWHLFDCLALLCLVGIAQLDRELYAGGPRILWERLYGNGRALGRLGSLPGEWQDAYEQACGRAAMPRVRGEIGSATVDVYDFSTAVALMNGLNLDSRPVFQGYSAYTPSLEGWNLRFYQSARAPDYLLWNGERVDGRYPGEDDAMLVAALAGHYRPLFCERDYWLLKRQEPLPPGPMERTLLTSRTLRLSEELAIPNERGHAIWISVNPIPNALGRLRALLYKPAQLYVTTTDERGGTSRWRLVPRVSRAGFILAPLLETADDAAAFMRGESRTWIRSLHLEAPAGQEEFWSRADVALYALPSVPVRTANDEAGNGASRP